MFYPQDATTVDALMAWVSEQTGQKQEIEPGVRPYVALFLAAGIVTSSAGDGHPGQVSCNGMGDGRPWVLVDGETEDAEILALLNAAKLGEGVEITLLPPYEDLPFEYSEKKVTFPRNHPASEAQG